MTHSAVLALGANLGQPREALRQAVTALRRHDDVVVTDVSGLWRTAAVGGPEQPDYVNAVVLVQTTLDPPALLALALDLEAAAGRVRAERWGPRTLDIDVLTVDDMRRAEPNLTLPHPRAHIRGFVLRPWAEVAPDHVLAPIDLPARTVAEWAESVSDQAVDRMDDGSWWR